MIIVIATLVRLGRMPGLSKAANEGRDLTAASMWLYVEAGITALLCVLYLVQRSWGGEPNVYTAIRLTLTAAIFAVMVRIALISDRRTSTTKAPARFSAGAFALTVKASCTTRGCRDG